MQHFFKKKNALEQEIEYKYCHEKNTTQQTFICSKSTIEALEKGVKYVQS